MIMSHVLRRVSTSPNSPLAIKVDQADPDNPDDAGLAVGGSFEFYPAGQDGDTAQVSAHAARVIMGDKGLAQHFECTPALPDATAEAQPDQTSGAQDNAVTGDKPDAAGKKKK
jgi:hypothetical protein